MTASVHASLKPQLTSLAQRRAGEASPAMVRELFAVLGTLDSQSTLRRSLTDPSHEAQHRSALAGRLFSGKVSDQVVELLKELVSLRSSQDRALTDSLEQLAVLMAGYAAENLGGVDGIDRTMSDVLAVQSLLEQDPALQAAFSDVRGSDEAKLRLLDRVAPTLTEIARALVEQALTRPRGMVPTRLLTSFADTLAIVRGRWIAHVASAVELDGERRERLRSALSRAYGRDLQLDVVHDPALVGGLRVEVGDEVIDGSVGARLNELQMRLGA